MPDFKEIEGLMSELLEVSDSVLSRTQQGEVQEFIEVGEYGLALETAVDIYFEERKPVTPEVVGLVKRLAEKMRMDVAPLLSKLQK